MLHCSNLAFAMSAGAVPGEITMMMAQITKWQSNTETLSKASHSMAMFGRGNLEALTQSTQAYVTGLQDLSRLYGTMVQGFTQQAAENAKAFAGAKTPQAVLAMQGELTRASIAHCRSNATKLQQATQDMMKQVSAPLTQRMAAAAGQTKLAQPA
jgi:phasin family protein